MRCILPFFFSVISLSVCSQNITDLEKQKAALYSRKSEIELNKITISKEYDSIFTKIDLDKYKLELVKSRISKSNDSLKKLIEPFGISLDNLKMYDLLKNEKIIDPNSKKYTSYCKKLNKAFNFLQGQEFFVITEFICLKKFDNNGKISSFEKIKLSSDQLEKQNKLLSKKSISLLSENNLILENLTGVNSKYLFLNEQLIGINDKMKTLNSELKSLSERKENIHLEFTQKKNNIEDEIEGITTLISEIDLQIIQINEQIAAEAAKTLNYSKFKTKKINGVEVYPAPLSVREFRNGDEIKKARTEGEWKKFNELKIPAYHFKDFDDNRANYGFIYNYYAITDNRELAPHGFHKLNLIDFDHLENQLLFTDTKLVNCYCGDGTEGIYESCTNCNYWTETQRKYNVCSKCQNRKYFKRGTKKCSRCNGTKKIKALNMEDREFCVFPSSTNNIEFENSLDFLKFTGTIIGTYGDHNLLGVLEVDDQGKCNLINYSTEKIHEYGANISYKELSYKEQGFQVLICKDDIKEYFDNFQYSQIGDVEIMNTFLKVTKFRNGDPIKYIEDPVEWELALKNKIPAYCYFNNIDDGTGCIYNEHAYNDKRGLIPKGWDEITYKDLVNMSFVLNYSFSLTSAYSPMSPPKGIRLTDGTFKEIRYDKSSSTYGNEVGLNFFIGENYSLQPLYRQRDKPQSGYILCTRNAQIPYNIKNKIHNHYDKTSLLSSSKLIDREQKYFTPLEKSGDYLNIYNDSGIAVIDYLVKSNFNDLFDENGELRIICMDDVKLHCKVLYCCGFAEYFHGNYRDSYTGLIIKKTNDEKEPFIGTAIIGGEIIESQPLIRKDELIFEFNRELFSFCFSRNKCNPSDNPLDNFYIKFGSSFGIDTKWYSKVKGDNWRINERALEKVLEFMNTH